MEKHKSRELFNKTNPLTEKEIIKLEKLEETFGKKFGLIDIEGDFVYGCGDNKRVYLGTKKDYYEYRTLKHQKLTKKKVTHENRFETYNPFNL